MKNRLLYVYGSILSITSVMGAILIFYGINGKYHSSYIGTRFSSIGLVLAGASLLLIFQLEDLFNRNKSTPPSEFDNQIKQLPTSKIALRFRPVQKGFAILFILVGIVLLFISWIH